MNSSKVFIVSTGRTGTRTLAYVLGDAMNGIYAIHEPVPSSRVWHYRKLEVMKNYGKVATLNSAFRDDFAESRELYYRWYNKVYIESNSFLSFYLDTLLDMYDDAIGIIIYRDGRDIVRTGVSRPDHRNDRFDLYGDEDDGLFVIKTKMWKFINDYLYELEHNDKYAGRIYSFHYEGIFGEDRRELSEFHGLLSEFGVYKKPYRDLLRDITTVNLNKTSEIDFKINDKYNWDIYTNEIFYNIARDTMEKLGYETDNL